MRDCDGCTKCCDGHLSGIVLGQEISPGGCRFVQSGIGCKIYEDRPERPCKTYECFWRSNEDVPENFKPSLTGMIITEINPLGVNELNIIPAGGHSEELIDWFIEYTQTNNINATTVKDGVQVFSGTPEYIEKRKEQDRKNHERLNPNNT